MDSIIEDLIEAGYYRARISNLSDFDKIIGGMAWAMQIFSCDLNIDIFYTDTLDLGQKISLTERLVMVLIVMQCPHQIEPHQIVGLDYTNLVPVIKWLIKKSSEMRKEHEAFNRLLALRHFFRVTNSLPAKSNWTHLVSAAHMKKLGETETTPAKSSEGLDATRKLIKQLDEKYSDNKRISFVRLPTLLKSVQRDSGLVAESSSFDQADDQEEEEEEEEEEETEVADDIEPEDTKAQPVGEAEEPGAELDSEKSAALHAELDTELLATNQKILNLLKKLDSMPSQTEISQYQKRFIELHQQLISKNKDVKKLYALFNSLESSKHYLTKEINLLDSIASNLDLTENSTSNRSQFLVQFQDIVTKIAKVKEEVCVKLDILKRKCEALNEEYDLLSSESAKF